MEVDNSSFINTITSKFLRHLGSIERLKKSYNLIDKEETDTANQSLGQFVAYILHLKFRKVEAQRENDWDKVIEIEGILSEFKEDPMFKAIDKNTVVHETDDDYSITIESGLLRKAYNDFIDNSLDLAYDDSQFQNSLIVSLVIGLEILVAEIFKDYVNNLDISEQVLKDKKLDFKLLREIGSVEEAKSFLIDQYIEKLLRTSFNDWLNEFKDTIKIDMARNPFIKNDIKLINETIQRRHLIIHNDGRVNDLYFNKIDHSLRENLTKGEILSSDYGYIDKRIATFRKFGLILIYLYGLKKQRNNMDQFFIQYNGLLLLYIKGESEAPRYIFKAWAENDKLSPIYQAMSKVNYFLTYKLNDDDSINNEIMEFDAEKYGNSFILAKKILLEDADAEKETIKYLSEIDNDDFINTLTWPLLKLVKKSDEFKRFVHERMDLITKEEMDGELVETK